MAKSTPSGPNDIFNGDQQERIYQEVLDTGKERLEKLNDKKNVEKIIKVLEDEKSTFGDAYKDVKKVINEYLEKKYPDTDPDYKEKREQERAVAERKIRNMILNSLGRATDVLQAKIDNTTKEGGKKNEKLAEALGKLKTIADNWTMEQAEKARDATTRKATPTKAPAVPKAPARPATTRGPAPATGTATTGTGTAGGLGRAPTRGPRTPERPVATKAEVVDLGERVKRVSDASKRDFDKVDKKIDAKIGEVKDEIKVLDGKMDGIDGRVKEIEKRLGIIGDTIEKWDREEEERRKKIEDEEKKRKETPDPKEKKKIDVRIKIEEDRKKFIEKKKKEKEKERIELKKEKLKLDKEKEAARIALRKAQKKWDEMVKKNPGIIDEFAKAEEAAKEIGAIRTALDGHAMYMRDVPVTEINGIDDFNTNKTKWDNVKNVYGAEPNGTDLARGAENKLFWFYTKDGKEYRMALDEETTNKYLDWKEYLTVGKEVMVSLNQQIQDLGIDIRGKEISDAGVQKQIEEKAKEVFEGMLEQLDPSKYSKEARYALALHTLGVTSMNAAYEKVKDMIKEQLGKEKTSRDAEGVEEAKGMTVPTVAEIKSPEDIRKARTKWENVVNKYGEAPNIDDRTRGDLYWRDFDASTPKEKLGKDKRGKDELTEYRKWIQYYGRRQYCETTVRIIVDKNIQAIKDLTDPHQADTDARDVAQKMAREIHNPDPKHLAGEGLTKENFVALMHDTMGVETEEQAFLKFLNLIKLARIPKGREGKNVFEVADRIEFPPRKLSEVIREDKKAGETLVSSMYRVIRHINKIYGKGLELSLYEMHRALIDIIKCRGSRSTLVKQLDGKSKAIPADIAKKIYIDFLLAKNEHLGEQDLLAVMIAFEPKKPYVFNIRRGDSGWAKEEKKTGETDEILDDFCTDGSIFAELQDKLGMETREFIKFVSKVAPNYKKIRDEILDVAGGKKFTKEQVDEVARSNKIEPAERLYSLMMISLWADKIGQAYKHALYLDQEGGVMVPQIVEHQGPDIEFFGKINSMEDFKKAKARWDKVENQFGEKPDKKEVFGKSVSLARNEDTRFDRGPVIGGTSVGGEELYWEDGKPLNAQELNEYRTWRTYFDLAPDIKKNVDRILQNVGIDVRNKGPFSKDSEEVKTVGKEALKLMLEMVDQYLGHSKDNSPDSPDDNRFSESARLMLVFYALDGDFAVINKKQAYEKIRDILAGKLETERTARDSKTMESAGEMVVPTVLEIKSPEDIRLCLEKWNNVVNKYGEKAGDSDFVGNSTGGFDDEKSELYWKKDMPGEMGKGLGEDLRTFEDKHSYREFMDYYTKTRMSVLHDVDTGVDSVMILHTDGRPEELEADARDEARKLTERLLGNYKEGGKQAMLFYAMGVKMNSSFILNCLT